jgi:hypothetical protein
MNHLLVLLFALCGGFCGQVLGQLLPVSLFYRHATWLTQEEFRIQFPNKEWVCKASNGLLLLAFFLFAPLFFSTDLNKESNWFFLALVLFCWMSAVVAVPELVAKVSILVWLGRSAQQRPVLYAASPNASWAGVFRLAMTAVTVIVLLWVR